MSFRRKQRSPWVLFILLAVIVSLLWFFIDIKNTNNIQVITDLEQEIAKPMPNTITVEVLDRFTNRLAIGESDLSSTQPYAISAANKNEEIRRSTSSTVQLQNNSTEPVKQ